ncbi:DUF2993 domain-containing protein [Antrihabitans sp. YC3-6]|uniref:DUF2993 domain-containing protein n=1 Tax=Antrihabitans stalagmiti TaxID=2799499 RepID=A0A934NR74_9NOCA|nr:DUF2993 domain-containing protein [Antrihabitans stalagmiti]MBJ8339740.1 DUF2993 domain-containing protein [Antrihabitans stalagmiti]
MRNKAVLISTLVVAALVAALIAGEVIARHTAKKCMSQQFESQLGTQVDIGLSVKPMLLQLIDKKVPYVTVDSDDSAFGPAKDMEVHARVNDVVVSESAQSSGTIGSSSADIEWPTAGIQTTMSEQLMGGLISGVRSSESDGTLLFAVGPGGLATLTVKPRIVGDVVQVDTMQAQVLGIGLPTDLVDGVVKVISDSLQAYPLGMKPKSLEVTDEGIHMSLAGEKFVMPPPQSGADSCGVLS